MDIYIKTEDYEIAIEQEGDVFFLHCDVWNFSPSVMKEIKYNFYNIVEAFLEAGVDSLYAYTTNAKFCENLLPCEIIGEIELADEAHSIVEWNIVGGLS
jgi:hypothetical protein